MLDEKLNILIQKYGIYDAIGGAVSNESTGYWNRLRKSLRRVEGEIRLLRYINDALNVVAEDANAALWIRDKFHPHELKFFWGLLPTNRRKIRFVIQDAEAVVQKDYYGRPVLNSRDFMHIHPEIQAIIILEWDSKRCANLIGRHFQGTIIDMYSIVLRNDLLKFFPTKSNQEVYADIFVARHYQSVVVDYKEKKQWHKMLIAHYLRIRDFLNVKKEIQEYARNRYEDSKKYLDFLFDLEKLLSDIKSLLANRKQCDVLIFWLDSMEKEEFYAMRWLGTVAGKDFHCAYTTMNFTASVCKTIFCGQNMKAQNLRAIKKIKLQDSVFCNFRAMGRDVHVFSNNFFSKLDKDLVNESCRPFLMSLPLMVSIWYALDTLLSSSNSCVNLLHCLETHSHFQCGEIPYWVMNFRYNDILAPNQAINYKKNIDIVCDYIDRQLEWYSKFFPPNTVSIYLSDHGMEQDLSEQNVNMPFKVVGKNIGHGIENRLFSYKDLHILIDSYMNPKTDVAAFTDFAIIDAIDPYDKGFVLDRINATWNKYTLERKKIDKKYLKRYLQTTKVVTAAGEYYTINILGEETYYRDKECMINLIDNPSYADRIAELRDKAGKFYNPWKEKRQVAIDFYEYLGIKEKDILAQCY